MSEYMLTPICLSAPTRVGPHLWRKQVLPEGSIDYLGRKVHFTPEKLTAMASAFDAKAFDSVPLVMADKDNKHTMSPMAATGRVVDCEYVPGHGLDLLVRPDEAGQAFLEKNKDVGVSARIVENYARADGKHFPAAIQHALITWDPRITGMAPWESVDLSNEDETVLDLSTYLFGTPGVGDEETTMSDLSKQDMEDLKVLLAAMREANSAESDDDLVDETETDADVVTESDESADTISDDELERVVAELEAEGTDESDGDIPEDSDEADAETSDEPVVIAAANESAALELANAERAELAETVRVMRDELNEKAFKEEALEFSREYGIPPVVLEKAKPLLLGNNTLELSNGTSVDAGAVMRDVLKALGEQVNMLDLSHELGRAADFGSDADSPDNRAAQAAKDRAVLGI